jgi:hypothetical protein
MGAWAAYLSNVSPFFQFVLALVVPGVLVVLLAVLLWTGR